jgi:hypothetical protein
VDILSTPKVSVADVIFGVGWLLGSGWLLLLEDRARRGIIRRRMKDRGSRRFAVVLIHRRPDGTPVIWQGEPVIEDVNGPWLDLGGEG